MANEVSHRLNKRLSDLTYLVDSEKVLRAYYEKYPVEDLDNFLLTEVFSTVNEFMDTVLTCQFSNEDRLLICAYIYNFKGELRSVTELLSLVGVSYSNVSYDTGGVFSIELRNTPTNDIVNFERKLTAVIKELLFVDDYDEGTDTDGKGSGGVILRVKYVTGAFEAGYEYELKIAVAYSNTVTGSYVDFSGF